MLVFRIKVGEKSERRIEPVFLAGENGRGFEATPSSLIQPEVDAADPGVDADIDCHR
jgi:hypothetical protein